MRIIFLTRSLAFGGSERQLTSLARGLRQKGHTVTIVTLYGDVPLAAGLAEAGVHLEIIGKRGRWDVFSFTMRLRRIMKTLNPDVIHSYMANANLIAAIARPLLPRVPLVWGVRSSDVDFSKFEWLTRLVYRAEPLFSRIPDRIIVNSQAGFQHAVARGYDKSRLTIVPNGFDVDHFAPDAEARRRLRAEWGIEDRERLVGMVGRMHPFKDHPTFLQAAAIVAQARSDVRFVIVGDDPLDLLASYRVMAAESSISDRIRFEPARRDVNAVYCAFDILVSSSYTEGFPNVIAEAMACGTPCVATDAGDSRFIIGDGGIVVPRRDPHALAEGILRLLDDRGAGKAARDRIVSEFSLATLVSRTESVLNEVREG